MALFHFSRSIIQKSQGHCLGKTVAYIHRGALQRGASSIGKEEMGKSLSYIHRSSFTDDKTDRVYAFKAKENEQIISRIYLPEKCPEDIKEIEKLWEHPLNRFKALSALVDFIEDGEFKIIDDRFADPDLKEKALSRAQTSFVDEFSLQNEFSLDENMELAEKYIEMMYLSRGLVATAGFHIEEGNPHVHVNVTTRPVDENGFLKRKERDLFTPRGLVESRKVWADLCNEKFEEKGLPNRISHLSYREQGVELLPTIHEGVDKHREQQDLELETRGGINREIAAVNAEMLLNNPDLILKKLATQRAYFSEEDIAIELNRHIKERDVCDELARVVVKSKEIEQSEAFGAGQFVMKDVADMERNLLKLGEHLRGLKGHNLDLEDSDVELDHLSDEQMDVLEGLAENSGGIGLLRGRAGVGKSTVMVPLAKMYEEQGYEVIALSRDGRTVDELAEKLGVEGRTVKGMNLFLAGERGRNAEKLMRGNFNIGSFETSIDKKTLLIVDEAGNLGSEDLEELLYHAAEAGSKVILLGDERQIGPIGSNHAFFGLSEHLGYAELGEIRRQKIDWMRDSSMLFAAHDIADGLKMYSDQDRIHFVQSEDIFDLCADAYLKSESESVILGFTNKDVLELNNRVFNSLLKSGEIKNSKSFETRVGSLGLVSQAFGEGSRIMFLENDNKQERVEVRGGQGVRNGSFGTISSIRDLDELGHLVEVDLDHGGRAIFNPREYDRFTHGYAMTVDKAQGLTVEKSILCINGSTTASKSYVAFTRHEYELQAFVDEEKFKNLHDLSLKISRPETLNFSLSLGNEKENEEAFGALQAFNDARREAFSRKLKIFEDHDSNGVKFSESEHFEGYSELVENEKSKSIEVLKHWDVLKNRVPISRYSLEINAGLRERVRTKQEEAALELVSEYKEITTWFADSYKAAIRDQNLEHIRPNGERVEKETRKQELIQEFGSNISLYKPLMAEKFINWDGVMKQGGLKTRDEVVFKVVDKAVKSASFVISKDNAWKGQHWAKPFLFEMTALRREKAEILNPGSAEIKNAEVKNQDPFKVTPRFKHIMDVDGALRSCDLRQAKVIVNSFLGDKISRETAHEVRFRNRGSFTLKEHKGIVLYHDFESGQGGNMIGFLQSFGHMDFKDAVKYIGGERSVKEVPVVEYKVHQAEVNEAERQKRLDQVNYFVSKIKPIECTIAQTYLENRGIDCELTEDLGFAWRKHQDGSLPALVIKLRDEQGNITGLQSIVIDEETGLKADVEVPKRVFGFKKGTSVKLQEAEAGDNRVLIAEGIETSLSLKQAGIKGEIRSAIDLGNIYEVARNLPKHKEIVLCADNDGPDSSTHSFIRKTKAKLELDGFKVTLKEPPMLPGHTKTDFNDLLRHGSNPIREVFKEPLCEQEKLFQALEFLAIKRNEHFNSFKDLHEAQMKGKEINMGQLNYAAFRLFEDKAAMLQMEKFHHNIFAAVKNYMDAVNREYDQSINRSRGVDR